MARLALITSRRLVQTTTTARAAGPVRAAATRRSYATASDQRLDNRVKLVEVGPRDGLQNEKTIIPLQTKLELIERLARTGLTWIEAGSFVSPKWVPQVFCFSLFLPKSPFTLSLSLPDWS